MFITGIGVAAPEECYRQSECWEALQAAPQFSGLAPRSRSILRKVLLGENGITTRHLALNPLAEAFDLRPDTLHRRFKTKAPELAERAARAAMLEAGVTAAEIDVVLISTCTGYLCPGLSSYVGERLGLRPGVIALDLVGQGCGAALPNLQTAAAYLGSGLARQALSICVEVCSAAMYLDDDPGVLVSACLFGDGAAAAVLSTEPSESGRRVAWGSYKSALRPEHRELLRFEQRDGLLRNILSLDVPPVAARQVRGLFLAMSDEMSIASQDVAGWILHAGGKNVLEAVRTELNLSEAQTKCSADILSAYGNVSSPFVLFTLKRALEAGTPGGWWWMSSFGAGFSCAGAFLRVGGEDRSNAAHP